VLADDYGVPVASPIYVTGGLEEPGRPEKLPIALPPAIRIERIGPAETLSSMLARGAVDALYTAPPPPTVRARGGAVTRLFPDFAAVEHDYFRRTGIFPIMHTVVVRRDVYERHRWVAQSLYKAFCQARQRAHDHLGETAALSIMLPWLPAHLDETRREMGRDFWPYGLESNRATLSTFLRYAH